MFCMDVQLHQIRSNWNIVHLDVLDSKKVGEVLHALLALSPSISEHRISVACPPCCHVDLLPEDSPAPV